MCLKNSQCIIINNFFLFVFTCNHKYKSSYKQIIKHYWTLFIFFLNKTEIICIEIKTGPHSDNIWSAVKRAKRNKTNYLQLQSFLVMSFWTLTLNCSNTIFYKKLYCLPASSPKCLWWCFYAGITFSFAWYLTRMNEGF